MSGLPEIPAFLMSGTFWLGVGVGFGALLLLGGLAPNVPEADDRYSPESLDDTFGKGDGTDDPL